MGTANERGSPLTMDTKQPVGSSTLSLCLSSTWFTSSANTRPPPPKRAKCFISAGQVERERAVIFHSNSSQQHIDILSAETRITERRPRLKLCHSGAADRLLLVDRHLLFYLMQMLQPHRNNRPFTCGQMILQSRDSRPPCWWTTASGASYPTRISVSNDFFFHQFQAEQELRDLHPSLSRPVGSSSQTQQHFLLECFNASWLPLIVSCLHCALIWLHRTTFIRRLWLTIFSCNRRRRGPVVPTTHSFRSAKQFNDDVSWRDISLDGSHAGRLMTTAAQGTKRCRKSWSWPIQRDHYTTFFPSHIPRPAAEKPQI